MKRIILAVVLGVASMSSINVKAQVSVNINIGQQPEWGPTGYDHVDYYYLPDVDAYYYVPSNQYIYLLNGVWVWRSSLPARYSNYDLYNGYKVVMNTRRPYLSHQNHVAQYSKYKNNRGNQQVIRDSKDNRYTEARNNRQGQNNRPTNNQTPTQMNAKPNSSRNGSAPSNRNNERQQNNNKNNNKERGGRG